MKLLVKSIKNAHLMINTHYHKGHRPYHFAFLFKKKRLISVGINQYTENAKILNLAKKFNIQKYKLYSYPHAETDAISKVWGKIRLDDSCSIVIIRLNKFGQMQNSKPCKDCSKILKSIGIHMVWWSENNGRIVNER